MSTNRFLTWISNVPTLVQAIAASAGVADADKIISTNSAGKIDATFLPAGVGDEVVSIVASEALTAGDFVNIYDNGGSPNVRKADASNNRAAHGFVAANVSSSGAAMVYRTGTNAELTGLTIGSVYFLSAATPGGVTTTAPSTNGHIIQAIGVSQSASEIIFEYDQPILLSLS